MSAYLFINIFLVNHKYQQFMKQSIYQLISIIFHLNNLGFPLPMKISAMFQRSNQTVMESYVKLFKKVDYNDNNGNDDIHR